MPTIGSHRADARAQLAQPVAVHVGAVLGHGRAVRRDQQAVELAGLLELVDSIAASSLSSARAVDGPPGMAQARKIGTASMSFFVEPLKESAHFVMGGAVFVANRPPAQQGPRLEVFPRRRRADKRVRFVLQAR